MCKITIFFVFHIIYIIKNEKKRILQPLYNVSSTKILIVNQCVSNSPSKIRPMVRVEYKGQACLPFVEAKPIAAGRAGWGALIAQEKVL